MSKCNLYVKNFDADVTEEDLKIFFSVYGTVKNVKLYVTDMPDGTKVSKKFGFVCFEQ